MTALSGRLAVEGYREGRTLIGVTELGLLQVSGRDALDLLHRLSTNDLRPLKVERCVRSTIVTTPQGRMVDWCWVLARSGDLLLRTSTGRAPRVKAWLERFTILEDVESVDLSAAWRLIVVQGEHGATAIGLPSLPAVGEVRDHEGGYWTRGLPASSLRLEGIVPAGEAEALAMRAETSGAVRLDAGVLEIVRILLGVPSPEHEFAEDVSPLELRLAAPAVSFDKGCYVGQEVIARLETYDKLSRVLMGFESPGTMPSSGGLELVREGASLGRVTSAAALPMGGTVGLAVIKREAASEGPADAVGLGGKVAVELKNRPFWAC